MSYGNFGMKASGRLTELIHQTLLCIIDALGLGYPSRGRVSVEPRSASLGNDEHINLRSLNTRHASGISRVWGLVPKGNIKICDLPID